MKITNLNSNKKLSIFNSSQHGKVFKYGSHYITPIRQGLGVTVVELNNYFNNGKTPFFNISTGGFDVMGSYIKELEEVDYEFNVKELT